jgi:hypothetical protein
MIGSNAEGMVVPGLRVAVMLLIFLSSAAAQDLQNARTITAAEQVKIDTLAPPKAGDWGPLTQTDGGFPENLWTQANGELVIAAFAHMAQSYFTISTSTLARRLLLSAGRAPQVDARRYLAARASALYVLGATADVQALARQAAPNERSEKLHSLRIMAQFAEQPAENACASHRDAVAVHSDLLPESDGQLFLKIQAFCAALGGDKPSANLALDLARDALSLNSP